MKNLEWLKLLFIYIYIYMYKFINEDIIKMILLLSVFLIVFYIEKLNNWNTILLGIVPQLPLRYPFKKKSIKNCQ